MKSNTSKTSCKRGFTLIELLVVVLIIGILAAVAVPQYKKAVWKTRGATMLLWTEKVFEAQERYALEHGSYTQCLNYLDLDYKSAFPVDGFSWDGCLMSVKTDATKTPAMILNMSSLFVRILFTDGPYINNGFGVYLELVPEKRKVGGIRAIGAGCPTGDANGWQKILAEMGYTKEVVNDHLCMRQLNSK